VIHGDAVPGNILMSNQGVVLIDWQCPALGDPCEDIAAWLSPAMQWLYAGKPLTNAQADTFLNAFPSETAARYRTLAPLFHWRMAAHCQWKAQRGAADYHKALQLELAAQGAD
jgi:thiamine kinase-like enzyme